MIFKYLNKKEWVCMIACVALVAFGVYMELEIPDYTAKITTNLATPGTTVDVILADGVPMVALAIGSLIVTITVSFVSITVATSLCMRLRKLQFDRVQSFGMEEIDRFSLPSLITRSTNDITQIQMAFAMGMQVMVKAPIMALWAIGKVITKNWMWTSALAVALVLLLSGIGVILAFSIPGFKKMQGLTDKVNASTAENLSGIRVIRAYNAEEFQEARFEKGNEELTGVTLTVNHWMAGLMPMMNLVLTGLPLAIYCVGTILIKDALPNTARGAQLLGELTAYTSYAMSIVMSFVMLVMIFMILPRASVASKRIQEVINTEPSIKDGAGVGPTEDEGTIEFMNVSFRYPGATQDSVHGVSFKANKGEVVAFIGSTGSGKTSLVNLVPRFYDATEGTVFVDGHDVRDYTLEELHDKIGYVAQKAQMFSGTVDSNVRYGKHSDERTEEDVKRAVQIAQATDFVEKMEGGYMGHVAEEGQNLSGGQKQRLSIARAVCLKPEIYIFDDTFSALDYKTDRVLRDTLAKETAGVTSLIVAQRIGTIMEADKIIVLDNGEVVGMGRHDELLKECQCYRDIALSQLTEEELMR